ncbi:MAG: hypothetical protein KDJ76_11900 [Xanthobacteraceae bacterium]|nr:hypothetical protein [Xanthobacteraceae bacterium]
MKTAIVLLGSLTLWTTLEAAAGTPAGTEFISLVQALGPIKTATMLAAAPKQCGPLKPATAVHWRASAT